MKATNTTQQSFSLWGWLSSTSLFSFFYSFLALFFTSRPSEHLHPEGPIYAVTFPKEVTLSSVQKWLQEINFETTLNLAERAIEQNPPNPTATKIQELQKTATLVRSKMPQLPNCENWTPITTLLNRVDNLTEKVLPQKATHLPILRAPSFPSLFTRETFGLGNWMNDCFMNATLQMIFSSPWLVKNIIYGKGQNLRVKEIHRQWEDHYERGAFTAPYLANPLRALNEDFAGSGQHDATEFLMTLIQPLTKEKNPLFFNQQTTTFYEGAATIKNVLKEGNEFNDQGGKTKSTLATSLEIILPENQNNLSMETLIQQTFNEQLPEDASAISFEKRDQSFAKLKPQRKETKINPPPYLFVDVKRHGFLQAKGLPYKINNEIDFKEEFTIPAACTLDGQEAKYRWVSFALHQGKANDGHYVAYVHDQNGYHYYSDARKKTIPQNEFLQEGQKFYLGFAERISNVDPVD
jgi:hypothetical protein